jgi:exonuclease SbcC
MILRSISLKNYRKYRSLEIEFPTGLIGVVGRNGMGKTTMLEAVAFALYGSDASRTKAKGVRREDARSDEACEVKVDFEVGGEPYSVIRRLRGINEAQQAELYRGTSRVPRATQSTGVTVAIRKLLAMDYSTFTKSVYSKQKEVNALSDAVPEKRRQAIRRMVGVETITRARDEAKAERHQKEAEVEGARRAIEVLPEKKAEEKQLKPRLKAAQVSVREAAQLAVEASKATKVASARLDSLENKRSKYTAIKNQVSDLSGRLNGAEKGERQIRAEIASLEGDKQKLAKLLIEDREFGQVCQEKERLDQASGKYEERVRLEDEIRKLEGHLKEAEAKLETARPTADQFRVANKMEQAAQSIERKARAKEDRLQKVRGDTQKKLGSAESQVQKAKQALDKIRRLGAKGQCPTCYRELGDSFEEIIDHLDGERKKYAAEADAVQKRISEIDLGIRAAKHAVDEAVHQVQIAAQASKRATRAKEQLVAAKQNYVRLKNTLLGKHKRHKMLSRIQYDEEQHRLFEDRYQKLSPIHDQVESLRGKVGRLASARRDMKALHQEIRDLHRRIARLERRRSALKFNQDAYDQAREASTAAQKADKDAAVEHSRAKGELDRIEEALRRIRGEIKHLEKQRDQIAKDEEQIRYLTRIETLLHEFRTELINRVRPQIEEYASMLFDQVTDGRYPRIVLDEDYNISIQDGSGAYPIRRFSGGEEDLANLCLRLAISQVVAHRAGGDTSSLVVLDEIFGSQDAERRERILQALVRLQETFQQIVLITHMEDIHDRVPNVLRITEDAAHDAQTQWL